MASLSTGSINPLSNGTICGVSSFPPGCEISPDVECERGGQNAEKILTVGGAAIGLSFATLVFILVLFTHHVYKVEQSFQIPARAIGNDNSRRRPSNDQPNVADENANAEVEQEDDNRMVLTKQAFQQSLLYILAFFVVYLGPMVTVLQELITKDPSKEEPEWRFWLGAILTPLGGIFNILIYTRPKVMKLMGLYGGVSYVRAFIAIVISGGEVPSLADLGLQRRPASMSQEGNDNEANDELHNNENVESFDEDLSIDDGMDLSKASGLLTRFGWIDNSSQDADNDKNDESNISDLSFDHNDQSS